MYLSLHIHFLFILFSDIIEEIKHVRQEVEVLVKHMKDDDNVHVDEEEKEKDEGKENIIIFVLSQRRFFASPKISRVYLPIPIKIRALSIFAHLGCAKNKEGKFARYECAKIKGRR